jgi:hypothetical protein
MVVIITLPGHDIVDRRTAFTRLSRAARLLTIDTLPTHKHQQRRDTACRKQRSNVIEESILAGLTDCRSVFDLIGVVGNDEMRLIIRESGHAT